MQQTDVDATLVGYFQTVEPGRFYEWVVSNMTYSNKLELLRKILKQHGLWEMYDAP